MAITKKMALFVVAGALVLYFWSFARPKFATTFKDDWHGSCKVMAFFVPLYFPEPLKYSEQSNVKDAYDTLGLCEAKKLKDGLWHVVGVYYNHRMVIDHIPSIKYEALMFEDNDTLEPAVRNYGTQYEVCSVAIDGIDRTGTIRYTRCGDGRYILDYKKKHGV